MRWSIRILAVGLLGAWCAAAGLAREPKGAAKPSEKPACGDYGTTVEFEKNPSAAATKAQKEEKLVMVLHVSGDFEDTEFT